MPAPLSDRFADYQKVKSVGHTSKSLAGWRNAPGDVVIMDNLSSHKERLRKAQSARLLNEPSKGFGPHRAIPPRVHSMKAASWAALSPNYSAERGGGLPRRACTRPRHAIDAIRRHLVEARERTEIWLLEQFHKACAFLKRRQREPKTPREKLRLVRELAFNSPGIVSDLKNGYSHWLFGEYSLFGDEPPTGSNRLSSGAHIFEYAD